MCWHKKQKSWKYRNKSLRALFCTKIDIPIFRRKKKNKPANVLLNCAWSGKGSSLTIYIVNLTENKASCFFFLHLLGPSDPLKGVKVYFNLFSCPEALILSFSLLQTSPSQIPLNPTFKLFPICGTFLSMSEGPTITYAGKGVPA